MERVLGKSISSEVLRCDIANTEKRAATTHNTITLLEPSNRGTRP